MRTSQAQQSGKQDSSVILKGGGRAECIVKLSTADLIWITFLGGEQQHRVCHEEKLSRLQLVYRNQTEIIPVIKCVQVGLSPHRCPSVLPVDSSTSGAQRERKHNSVD